MGLQCYRCPETHEDTEHGVIPACSSDYFGAAYLCKVRTVGNKTYPAQGCIKGMRGKKRKGIGNNLRICVQRK